ncbi:hypothetical protein ACHQM5_005329 [Ranunculus cassubicifolius]
MADTEKDDIPMLSYNRSQFSDEPVDVVPQRLLSTARSASMSTPMYPVDSYENQNRFLSYTGPLQSERRIQITQMSGPIYSTRNTDGRTWPTLRGHPSPTAQNPENPPSRTNNQVWPHDNPAGQNEHLYKSGKLGMCSDPYCTTCPTYYKSKPSKQRRRSYQFHNFISGDAKGWIGRSSSFLGSCLPGIMNPHAKVVQRWNKFFVISCLLAIFIDPLFFFLLSVKQEHKCISFNGPMAISIAVLRSTTDFIYLMHILLQFRLAYVAPESRVVGAGELVDQPKKIALNYLYGYFLIDVIVVLPLPQIMILSVSKLSANYAKNLLRATILFQSIPRFYRFLPLLAGSSVNGFVFETAWANFVINLLIFILAGHVVGSCWYLFGLQRVNQCLRNACGDSNLTECTPFIDCGPIAYEKHKLTKFNESGEWDLWKNDERTIDCFNKNGRFSYGIYMQAVNITTKSSFITRYIYSLFWGFQQISTLAGNQVPSDFEWEVLFTMAIVGLGLFLFALLIGNIQNFLQSLGRRRLEMQLRHRDVELWMSHRRLPEGLRRLVRQSERFHWAATCGVNEEVQLDNLPEDLQREIRRHLFNFIKNIPFFELMEEPILDAVCERLKQKLYIQESKILYYGGVVDKITFIVRGKLESVDVDGNSSPLSEGDICGEELISWNFDHSLANKDLRKIGGAGSRLLSNRTVTCLTNVEAFSLRVRDLEEVTALFPRFLRSPRVQGTIRYASPYWRALAATRIQIAWRYRNKCLNRAGTTNRG